MESLLTVLIVLGLPVLLALSMMVLLNSYRRERTPPTPGGKVVIVAGFSIMIGFLGWIGIDVAGDALAIAPFGEAASWVYLTYFLVVGALLGLTFTRKVS